MNFVKEPKRNLSTIILFAFMLALNCCAKKEIIPVGAEIPMDRTTFSSTRDQFNFDLFPEYHMKPGDVLDVLFQIRTWVERKRFLLAVDHVIAVKFVHAPELNEEQRIRPDGTVSLPYLGDVHVLGMTTEELTSQLKKRYSKILNNPDIFVVVPEFRSRIKELKKDLHTAPRGLSRLTSVRPDGYATFPMVGDVFVANRTLPDVTETLNDMYENILPGLHVDLFLERTSGSVVYVLGQVKTPGSYPLIKPISTIEALTLAGSYIEGAQLNSVIVVRKFEKKIIATRVDVEKTLDLKSPFFYLEPDDIVYVPKTWIKNTGEVMRDLADVVLFNGWGLGFGFSWELHRAGTTPTTTTTTVP